MTTTSPPNNEDAKTSVAAEFRLITEGMRDIKQQNWIIEGKIASLADTVIRKFDRIENRLNTRHDETMDLRQALLEQQNKVERAKENIISFMVFLVFLAVFYYIYSEVLFKRRFDWSDVVSHYYNLYNQLRL